MWMSDYIREIKRQFRDVHGFAPSRVVGGEPCFDAIPDGEYPMTIEGKLDRVLVKEGKISCCRFDGRYAHAEGADLQKALDGEKDDA